MLLFELELHYEPAMLFFAVGVLGFIGAFFRWYLAIPALFVSVLLAMMVLVGGDFFELEFTEQMDRQDPLYRSVIFAGVAVSIMLPILGAIRDLRRLWRINTKPKDIGPSL